MVFSLNRKEEVKTTSGPPKPISKKRPESPDGKATLAGEEGTSTVHT